jgi:hypothetical protein
MDVVLEAGGEVEQSCVRSEVVVGRAEEALSRHRADGNGLDLDLEPVGPLLSVTDVETRCRWFCDAQICGRTTRCTRHREVCLRNTQAAPGPIVGTWTDVIDAAGRSDLIEAVQRSVGLEG